MRLGRGSLGRGGFKVGLVTKVETLEYVYPQPLVDTQNFQGKKCLLRLLNENPTSLNLFF